MKTQLKILRIFSFLVLILLNIFNIGVISSSLDCDRLYFQHPSEKTFPYIHLVNRIYVKTEQVKDKYPVYKDERGDLYFSYNQKDAKFYFSTDLIQIKDFPGLEVKNNRTWNNIEAEMLFYYSAKHSVNIIAKCVSFIDCSENSLVIQVHNDKDEVVSTFNFAPITNAIINNRRVYADSQSRMKLYYSYNGFWRIGLNYSSTAYSLKSNAIKPEFIGKYWQKRLSSNSWKDVNISIDCQGSKATKCTPGSCKNSGVCNKNGLDHTFCTCKYGYYGQFCQRINHRKCNDSKKKNVVSKEFGSIRSEFCPKNSIQPFRTLICINGRNEKLIWRGSSCASLPIIGKLKSYSSWYDVRYNFDNTKKEKNLDNEDELKILLIAMVILIPAFVFPIVHHVIHCCFTKRCPSFTRTISKHAYAGVFVWLIFIIVYQASGITKYGPETFRIIFYVAIVFTVLGYFFVLCESIYCSKESEYLQSSFADGSGEIYMNSLLEKPPVVTINMDCFHMEQRSRSVHSTDSSGHTTTTTEHYQVRVATWTGKKIFNFNFWKDVSDPAKYPKVSSMNPILRINLKSKTKFADIATKEDFYEKKKEFIRNNRHRDELYSVYVTREIPGLKKRLLLYDNQQGLPSWIKMRAFVLYTVILCSWPYRLLLNKNTSKKKFVIIKLISNTPINTSQFTSNYVTQSSPMAFDQYVDLDDDEVRVATDEVRVTTVDLPPPPPPYEVAVIIGKLPKYDDTCV